MDFNDVGVGLAKNNMERCSNGRRGHAGAIFSGAFDPWRLMSGGLTDPAWAANFGSKCGLQAGVFAAGSSINATARVK